MADNTLMDNFRGIPMSDLIGAPLAAAGKAQQNLAGAMVDYVNLLAYGSTDSSSGTGGDSQAIKTLPMQLNRPAIHDDGTITTETVTVAPPLLGVVPIPALLVDTVIIDFSMTVESMTKSDDTNTTSGSASGKVGGMWELFSGSLKVSGSVSTQRENTRSTDKTAKYDVHVEAHQQPPTEGMSKLMDLLATACEPIQIQQASSS